MPTGLLVSMKGYIMKQIFLILLAVGTSLSLVPMAKKPTTTKKQSKKAAKKAQESFLAKYIDIGDLIISIGRAYKRKKTDAASLSIAILEAINIEKLPLKVADSETTVGEFFKGEELKECLSKFLTKWFEGKLRKRHIADLLEGLKDSMKKDAVIEEFGDEEWNDIEKGFNSLIARFSGEDVGDIADFIDLENAPELFGFILQDYFKLDKLNEALNDALNNKALTKSILLDCIDIEQIAEREGYNEIPNADGIREAIELFFSMMEDDEDATHKVFDILGAYRATKRAPEASSSDESSSEDVRPAQSRPTASSSSSSSRKPSATPARPATSSSSTTRPASRSAGRPQTAPSASERAAQESADAELARRLQDESSSEDVRPAQSRPTASSSSSSSRKPAATPARPATSSSSTTRPASRSAGRPQTAPSASERAAQESADAELARRLQREWDNE
jgi:hypothetical protein